MSWELLSISWGSDLTSIRSRRPGRRRAASRSAYRPGVEALERRLTLTTLPPGFTEASVVSGLSSPTTMEFAPDGRLFVLEQGGNVKLVHNDGTTWTALHLNVDSNGERPARHRLRPQLQHEPFRLPVLHQPQCRRRIMGHRRT